MASLPRGRGLFAPALYLGLLLGVLGGGGGCTSVVEEAPSGTGTETRGSELVSLAPAVQILFPYQGATLNFPPWEYRGVADAGATVSVVVDGTSVGVAMAEMNGAWVLPVPALSNTGSHTVTATARDIHGAVTSHSVSFFAQVETWVELLTPADGSVVTSPMVMFAGRAEPGAWVSVFSDGNPRPGGADATVPVAGDGSWSVEIRWRLEDGPHSVIVLAEDPQGHSFTDRSVITVDTQTMVSVTTPAEGSVLTHTVVTYSGTGEPTAMVTVVVDGAPVGTMTVGMDGVWSLPVAAPLADGTHTVSVTAEDAYGHIATDTNTFEVDATTSVAVTAPADGVVLSNPVVTCAGTGEPGATVTVVVDGNPEGVATVSPGGTWSVPVASALADGPHTVTATAEDSNGNTATDTNTFIVKPESDKGGWRTMGRLSIARAEHTATVLRSGGILVVGGTDAAGALSSTELYSPAAGGWQTVRRIVEPRKGHTATLLSADRVLITGGMTSSGASLSSSEVYLPREDRWARVDSMATIRRGHTATLLDSGKVLVIGGLGAEGPLAETEVFDPDTLSWSRVEPLPTPRTGHTATLLKSGEVLVTGGSNADGELASVALYDPKRNTWETEPPLSSARANHAAVMLATGEVLVLGGNQGANFVTTTEVYDPVKRAWTPRYSMGAARTQLTAVLLESGRVLVTGSLAASGTVGSTEVFSPSTGIWSPTGRLDTAREGHATTVLPSGDVLVTGGREGGQLQPLASTELFESLGASRSRRALPGGGREDFMMVGLSDGRVLVTGGSGATGVLADTQLYDPASDSWTSTAPLNTPRSSASATVLSTGEVLVAGGRSAPRLGLESQAVDESILSTVEMFDPVTRKWRFTGGLNTARAGHVAVLLSADQVLVTGGEDKEGKVLSSTELYNPITRAWTPMGGMKTPRRGHQVVQLPTGQVLVAGGFDAAGKVLSSVEQLDLTSKEWTVIDAMPRARGDFTAAVLFTGELLVVGGTDGTQALREAEVYHPKQGWASVGALRGARKAHFTQLLPTGRVLIAGGSSDTRTLDSVELYDPRQKNWEEMTPLIDPREGSMTVVLHNATLLVLGGRDGDGLSEGVEVYDEYGAPETYRPVVQPFRAQKPRASLVLSGSGMKAPTGGHEQVRMQLMPAGALLDTEATRHADTSVEVTLPVSPDGVHLLFVLVNDIAGGQAVHVDGAPPGAPSMTTYVREPTPSLSGHAEPKSTVQVSLNDNEVGAPKADPKGVWRLSLTAPLVDGNYTVKGTAMDEAGNVSLVPMEYSFLVDTVPPAAPVMTPPRPFIQATSPMFSGTAEPESLVSVSVDGVVVGSAPADLAGLWSCGVSVQLPDGRHTVSASATDGSKNTGKASAPLSFTVDTVAPDAPEISSPQAGSTIAPMGVSVSGVSEPGARVSVFVDCVANGATGADGAGGWLLTLPERLSDGERVLTASATDAAGNVSEVSTRVFSVGDEKAGGCSGCAAGAGEPFLLLGGLAALGRLLARRRSPPV